jgi:1,4-dihydroxy-6-naphthoate synthase
MAYNLAFSPCPNDTFIFAAIAEKMIDLEGLSFEMQMADVEALNQMALKGEGEMIKMSFRTWLEVRGQYALLDSGAALGFGNGPLVIARQSLTSDQIREGHIALPGAHTTAHFLFSLAYPDAVRKEFMLFSDIENAVLTQKADAGVIIHENRFTYKQKGLVKLMDLGAFWEQKTHAPIPLGGIMAKKSLGAEIIDKMNRIMHRSVQYAFDHPDAVMPFVRQHAQAMDESVMKKHIDLYVNQFTLDLGADGRRAIDALIKHGKNL